MIAATVFLETKLQWVAYVMRVGLRRVELCRYKRALMEHVWVMGEWQA